MHCQERNADRQRQEKNYTLRVKYSTPSNRARPPSSSRRTRRGALPEGGERPSWSRTATRIRMIARADSVQGERYCERQDRHQPELLPCPVCNARATSPTAANRVLHQSVAERDSRTLDECARKRTRRPENAPARKLVAGEGLRRNDVVSAIPTTLLPGSATDPDVRVRSPEPLC